MSSPRSPSSISVSESLVTVQLNVKKVPALDAAENLSEPSTETPNDAVPLTLPKWRSRLNQPLIWYVTFGVRPPIVCVSVGFDDEPLLFRMKPAPVWPPLERQPPLASTSELVQPLPGPLLGTTLEKPPFTTSSGPVAFSTLLKAAST